jgi:hypothetical protein
MKCRFGDWDAANDIEPFADVESNVMSMFIHERFNPANLQFNVAILRLTTAVPIGLYPTITNICLPSTPIKPVKCWVSGIN